jgi:hypothetical protein
MSVAAVATAGCGSSSNSTTPSAPATGTTSSTTSTTATTGQITAAVAPVITAFKAVRAKPQNAKRSSTWFGLAAKIDASVATLKGITVPPSAGANYQQAVSLLSAMATDARSIGTAVAHNDKAAANRGVQKLKQDAQKLTSL